MGRDRGTDDFLSGLESGWQHQTSDSSSSSPAGGPARPSTFLGEEERKRMVCLRTWFLDAADIFFQAGLQIFDDFSWLEFCEWLAQVGKIEWWGAGFYRSCSSGAHRDYVDKAPYLWCYWRINDLFRCLFLRKCHFRVRLGSDADFKFIGIFRNKPPKFTSILEIVS